MLQRPTGLNAFLLIWIGQLASLLGSGLTEFALGVWVYQQTGSATRFALTFLFATLPRILLSPFAGALIDRWDRRVTMLLSDLGAGLSTSALAALFWADAIAVWHIYLFAALGSLCSTFQRPAYAASIPLLASPEQLGRANGLVQTAQATASLLAPVLAGALLVAAGIGAIFVIDIATFLCAVATLAIVRFPLPPRARQPETQTSLISDTAAGFGYIWRRPGLRGLLLTFSAASFLGLATEILLTPYVLATASPDTLGLIASAGGAGLLGGGLALAAWGAPRRLVPAILGFELVVSLCMFLLGLSAEPWLLGALAFVYFMAIALGDGCSETLWQRKIAQEFQGRVFALRQMITLASVPLGVALLGPLAEYVFEPALRPGGAWAASIGPIVGVGPGRGIGLLYLLAGIVNIAIIALAFVAPRIRNLEAELPDGGV